jgi:hypothetical protein
MFSNFVDPILARGVALYRTDYCSTDIHMATLYKIYCDMHAVSQQSTVETLFITVAKQRNNGGGQRFLCGPFR